MKTENLDYAFKNFTDEQKLDGWSYEDNERQDKTLN